MTSEPARVGRYELVFELASGGMSSVFVARGVDASGASRLVAVKRLHAHLAKQAEFRDMVRDEANLATKIAHPNVVPVIDVVEQGDDIGLVLAYVPSVSLAALVKAARASGRPLPPPVVSRILSDVLAGLHAAHELVDASGAPLEVVHRDVSPQNVLVGVDGHAHLIDFGIAKAAVRFARTQSGNLKGKLPYMSPEQLQRKTLDRRADVFAAGAVLFEALASEPLFDGDDEGAVLLGVLMGTSGKLEARGFSAVLGAVFDRAVAVARDERYPSAQGFREALEAVVPPAPREEVRRAVGALCGPQLDALGERIRAADEARSRSPIAPTPIAVDATRRPRSRRFVAVALVASIGVGGAGALALRNASAPVASGEAEPAPAATPSSGVGAMPSAVVSMDSPLPSADEAETRETSASLEPEREPQRSKPSRAGTKRRSPTKAAASASAPLRKNPYR